MGSPIQQTFSIDIFRANFGNAARNSLFYIALLPASSSKLSYGKMTFLVRSTSIPAWSVEKKELGWQGYKMPFGGATVHDDWTCTFMVDKEAAIYKTMVDWKNMVHNAKTNVYGDPVDYMRDQRIQLLSLDGTKSILDIDLIGAFPTQVGTLELNYDNSDVATFQVTFAYVRHELV